MYLYKICAHKSFYLIFFVYLDFFFELSPLPLFLNIDIYCIYSKLGILLGMELLEKVCFLRLISVNLRFHALIVIRVFSFQGIECMYRGLSSC